jgi:hypothetical protein
MDFFSTTKLSGSNFVSVFILQTVPVDSFQLRLVVAVVQYMQHANTGVRTTPVTLTPLIQWNESKNVSPEPASIFNMGIAYG